MRTILVPPAFYDDHVERDLPAPPILRTVRGRYEVDADHSDFAELLSDANHYAHPNAPDMVSQGLIRSARLTVEAAEARKGEI